MQKVGRQLLRFVQHNDAAHDVVQLAAARGFGGEQGLEQLHVGGDDQRCIPVFASEAAAGSFIFVGRIGLAVMLDQHLVAQRFKHVAKHICGLFNDAGVGDGVDHAALAMGLRVIQGKRQTGQGFAASRGHREREEPGGQRGLVAALAQNVGAQGVDLGGRGAGRLGDHVRIQSDPHLIQRWKAVAPGGFTCIKVGLGV